VTASRMQQQQQLAVAADNSIELLLWHAQAQT
jgi:hypothetical protein